VINSRRLVWVRHGIMKEYKNLAEILPGNSLLGGMRHTCRYMNVIRKDFKRNE
jgi:hypothetical protein